MKQNSLYRFCAVSIILSVLCLAIGQALRSSYVKLDSAPSLSGQVAQATQSAGSGDSIPVPGKDFTLADVRYFSDKTWALVSFEPTSNDSFNAGLAILQKKDGIFQVVLGPSSTLPSDYSYSLPPDLDAYLSQKGVFN